MSKNETAFPLGLLLLMIYYNEYFSGKAAIQNGTVSGQTMLDGAETNVVNRPLISDGEVAGAATEEDAAVCLSSFNLFRTLHISFTED